MSDDEGSERSGYSPKGFLHRLSLDHSNSNSRMGSALVIAVRVVQYRGLDRRDRHDLRYLNKFPLTPAVPPHPFHR